MWKKVAFFGFGMIGGAVAAAALATAFAFGSAGVVVWVPIVAAEAVIITTCLGMQVGIHGLSALRNSRFDKDAVPARGAPARLFDPDDMNRRDQMVLTGLFTGLAGTGLAACLLLQMGWPQVDAGAPMRGREVEDHIRPLVVAFDMASAGGPLIEERPAALGGICHNPS